MLKKSHRKKVPGKKETKLGELVTHLLIGGRSRNLISEQDKKKKNRR